MPRLKKLKMIDKAIKEKDKLALDWCLEWLVYHMRNKNSSFLEKKEKEVLDVLGLEINPYSGSKSYKVEVEDQKPQKLKKSKIVYIEDKCCTIENSMPFPLIGRVYSSRTGRTLYYKGEWFKPFKSYKENYFDDGGHTYWISSPRQDGNDALYSGLEVTIDEDVREEYWRDIRKRPDLISQKKYRPTGKWKSSGRHNAGRGDRYGRLSKRTNKKISRRS